MIDGTELGILLVFAGVVTMVSSILWFYLDKHNIATVVLLSGIIISLIGMFVSAPQYQVKRSDNGETVFMETSYTLPNFDKYDECVIKTIY